jgi:hypothetical protein
MNPVQFLFKNFPAEQELEVFADGTLGRIREVAPYGSQVFGALEKIEDGYWCAIDVYSFDRPFSARKFAEHALDAIEGARDQIRQRFADWKKKRFDIDIFDESQSWVTHKHKYPALVPS